MGGSDLDFHLFGSSLTDQEVVFSLDVLRDRLIHLIAGHLIGTAMDDSGKRDHCNFRSAASNVDDHVSRWLRYR